MNEYQAQLGRFWRQLQAVNRHNIGTASTQVQWTVLALMALLFLLLVWLALFSPSLQKYQALVSQEKGLIQQFDDKYSQTEQYDKLQKQLLEQNAKLEQTLAGLPKTAAITQLIAMINTQAQTHGVQIVSAKAAASSEQEYYSERPITVNAVGSYHALGNWLFALLNSGYLLTVHDFSLQAQTDNRLAFTAQFKTYQAKKKPATNLPNQQNAAAQQTIR